MKASQKPAEPVGILTSEHRDTWAEVYSDLVKGVYIKMCYSDLCSRLKNYNILIFIGDQMSSNYH